ncbi:MAG: hypothetical protein QM763_05350 [Agriterribacter sp.]
MQLLTEFEIQYLSPIHAYYPTWPGKERLLQLYDTGRETQVVLTKGLSDGDEYLYEIYLESNDIIAPEDFSNSWQANLVYEAGRIVPQVPDFKDRLALNIYLSLQVEMEGAPEEWSLNSQDGNIGLFIGLPSATFKESTFKPLNIKLMRPEELLFSIENDKPGRLKLAELYIQQGNPTISNLERASVV